MTPDVAKNIALGLFLNPDNSGQEPPLDIACDFFRRLYSCTQTSEIRKLAEIVLLFVVGFFPAAWDMGANALVSFACAMQVQAFRKVHGYPFASTMCIGNLRSGMDSLVAFGHTRDKSLLYKALHYFGVILVFALGAGVGTQCVAVLGAKTIWLSCALLAVSLCFMFIKEDLEG